MSKKLFQSQLLKNISIQEIENINTVINKNKTTSEIVIHKIFHYRPYAYCLLNKSFNNHIFVLPPQKNIYYSKINLKMDQTIETSFKFCHVQLGYWYRLIYADFSFKDKIDKSSYRTSDNIVLEEIEYI